VVVAARRVCTLLACSAAYACMVSLGQAVSRVARVQNTVNAKRHCRSMAAVLKTLQEKLEHTAVDYRNCRKGAPAGLR
jgi:hypothetical protein